MESQEKQILIEVKYVSSKEGESMEVTLCRLGIYKKNGTNIEINNKHKYYHQIQQQLFVVITWLVILLCQMVSGCTLN